MIPSDVGTSSLLHCSDRDWRKSKDPSKPPEPTREWQQHGVGPGRRSMDAAAPLPWASEGVAPPRGRMTAAEMEEERQQMQKEWRESQSIKATAGGQMVPSLHLTFPPPSSNVAQSFIPYLSTPSFRAYCAESQCCIQHQLNSLPIDVTVI